MAWKYSLGSKQPLAIRKVCLSTNSYHNNHRYLDLGIVVVHDVVVVVALLLVDLQEVRHLLGSQLLALVAGGFVVHHLVQLGQRLGVVLVCMRAGLHFSRSASKSLRFLSTELFPCMLIQSKNKNGEQWSYHRPHAYQLSICHHFTRAYLRWQLPPMSITLARLGSSLMNTRLLLHTKSLSSISFSLRQYSLPSVSRMPTLDSVAKILLALLFKGNGVGWNLTFMPVQKIRSVSVLKMSEFEDASKSTIFSPLNSSSWVLEKVLSSRSLMTSGLVLTPKTPPLLTPLQQSLPLSSRRMMNLSMAATFFTLACLFSSSSCTSSTTTGVLLRCFQKGRRLSPLPQAYRLPWSQRATEKSLAALTLSTLWPLKEAAGIWTGTPGFADSAGTPRAPSKPHAQTAPSEVRAKEWRDPRLSDWMWMLGQSKETRRGSSVSLVEDCPSLPSSLRPTVQTALSLVRKPKWYSPVDTLATSAKFWTSPGVQCWPLVGLPHPQVVCPQVKRCPLEKQRLII